MLLLTRYSSDRQRPYDVIVLTEAAGVNRSRLPDQGRNLTQRPADTVRLEVTLLSHPDRRYEILWRDIARIDLIERMIYDEALKEAVGEGLCHGLHEP